MLETYNHSTSQQFVQILHVEIGKVIMLNDLFSSIGKHVRVNPGGWVLQGSFKEA